MTGLWLTRAAGAAAVLVCAVEPSSGEIHDYMIRRLVYLGTSCGTEEITPVDAEPGHRRYRVLCRNTSAYPDGLTVDCSDPEDDRSCMIEEKPREFEKLDLLRRPGEH